MPALDAARGRARRADARVRGGEGEARLVVAPGELPAAVAAEPAAAQRGACGSS